MNNKTSKQKMALKHTKLYLILFSLLTILFAVFTHLSFINFSLMYHFFGKYTPVMFFVFPLLSLALIIMSAVFIFKYNKMAFITPIALALAGTFMAIALVNDSSNTKMQSDFLKHESIFNEIVNNPEIQKEGIYEIDEKSIFFVAPEQKVIVKSISDGKFAYCIVTLDLEDRFEGYVYEPNGPPIEWELVGQYSEKLDINEKWSYFVYYKGVMT